MTLLIVLVEKFSASMLRNSGSEMKLVPKAVVFTTMMILLIVVIEKSSDKISLTSAI